MADKLPCKRLHDNVAKGAGYGGPAKGAGWGGPARGFHPAMTLAERSEAWLARPKEERKWIMAMREVQADDMLDRLHDLAMNNDQLLVPAALAFFRLSGQIPPERQELSGPGGTPLAVDRPPPETRAEWLARHRNEAAQGDSIPAARSLVA